MAAIPSPAADRTPQPRAGLALAALALLVGATVLITHPAARHSLWYDEAWSVMAIRTHDAATISAIAREEYYAPVYYWALSAWASLTGFSEPALRYSSALGALLTAAFVYRLTVDLHGSRAAGALAALALCTMPLHIRFAQEVRMYAALALLVAASMWLFWHCLAHPRIRVGLVYAAVTVAAIYIQYLALFLIPIQGFYAAARLVAESLSRKPETNRTGPVTRAVVYAMPFIAGVFFLPWLPMFLAQLTSPEYVPVHSHALPTSVDTIVNTLTGHFFAGQTILYLALIALAVISFVRRSAGWRLAVYAPRAALYLAAWGVGWLALMWGTNIFVPHYQARNALPALPVLAILVGVGLRRLPRAVGLILLIVMVAGNLTGYYTFQAHDPHYRDAVAELAHGYQRGDLVFVQTNSFLHDLPLQHYLDTLLPPHPEPGWFSTLAGGWSPGSEAFGQAFAERVGAEPRFWLLQTLPVDNCWLSDAAPRYVEVSNVHVDAFQIALYETR